jgi:hypothetical protein
MCNHLLREQTSCVSIRQHTSAYVSNVSIRRELRLQYICATTCCVRIVMRLHTSAYVSIRQHTSAYVSIRQHTVCATTCCVSIRHASAYVSTRQHTSAYVSIRQHTSAYVSIRQHTSAYVSIRQHTSAVCARTSQKNLSGCSFESSASTRPANTRNSLEHTHLRQYLYFCANTKARTVAPIKQASGLDLEMCRSIP